MGKLILTRKPGESVKIGNNIVLTIREVHPKKVYMEIQRFKGPFVERTDHVWMRLLESMPESDYSDGQQCKVTIAAISGRQVRLHLMLTTASRSCVRSCCDDYCRPCAGAAQG